MGPVASVPLPGELSRQQLQDLDQWLESLGTVGHEDKGGAHEWMLTVDRYDRLGIEMQRQSSCAFWIIYEPEPDLESFKGTVFYNDEAFRRIVVEEQQELHQLLGFEVKQRIALSAGCKQPVDHHILARLALELAERYNSVIDMHGEIQPLGFSYGPGGVALEDVAGEEHRERLRAYLRQFPGRVNEYYVRGARTHKLILTHLVDVEFMRAWVQHPDFLMNK